MRRTRIVILGGSSLAIIAKAAVLLSKLFENLSFTFINGPCDCGGSTGILRLLFHIMGNVGDSTKILAAIAGQPLEDVLMLRLKKGRSKGLSVRDIFERGAKLYFDSKKHPHPEDAVRELSRTVFRRVPDHVANYRYTEDFPLKDHSVKNLIAVGAELSFRNRKAKRPAEKALDVFHRICWATRYRIKVMASSESPAHLRVKTRAGHVVEGEMQVDNFGTNERYRAYDRIEEVALIPSVKASRRAKDAIRSLTNGDIGLISFGDPFSSVAQALLAEGMQEACLASQARFVAFLNVFTKPGESQDWTAEDFHRWYCRLTGKAIHKIVYHRGSRIPDDVLREYFPQEKVGLGGLESRLAGDPQLEDSLLMGIPLVEVREVEVLEKGKRKLKRVVRHKPEAVASALQRLLVTPKEHIALTAEILDRKCGELDRMLGAATS